MHCSAAGAINIMLIMLTEAQQSSRCPVLKSSCRHRCHCYCRHSFEQAAPLAVAAAAMPAYPVAAAAVPV
jgi:hypothetical protein